MDPQKPEFNPSEQTQNFKPSSTNATNFVPGNTTFVPSNQNASSGQN